MKISSSQPFQLIYSLYQHEFLGYLFESYVVQVDDKGKLTLQHQNISSKNADEFSSGLDEADFQLIELIDRIQQDYIIRKFSKKVVKPDEFFFKVYDEEKGNKELQREISRYLELKRASILSLMSGKMVFEMGSDGEPAWKELKMQDKKATVLFHFRKNNDNTHYFPTIKFDGEKLDFQYKGAFIVCKKPAWMVLDGKLFTFEREVDGNKLQPFLNKRFIVIPKAVEEQYFSKFVAPLIESFDVYAVGFEIDTIRKPVKPLLRISILKSLVTAGLFDNEPQVLEEDKVVLELNFGYGDFSFKADKAGDVNVKLIKGPNGYIFHRVKRDLPTERLIIRELQESGLNIQYAKAVLPKTMAFDWLKSNRQLLEDRGILLHQNQNDEKKYFLGEPSIRVEIKEEIDWFDIRAVIEFGEFSIPFNRLRKYIIKKQTEFELPNGEIAVIPESWLVEYGDLFSLSESADQDDASRLKKHHVSLVKELEAGNLARIDITNKLDRLKDFNTIDEYDMPRKFKGTLRPYQKAGYNWLRFLNEFKFGACLADDMGLGKTVQALTLLESQKELRPDSTSLLVLPTSLVYNWEKEAEKFTPHLKVFCYTGTQRLKDPSQFSKFDLIITSYGIVRLDIEILEEYFFNYVILDESQAIKNPSSYISKAVRRLRGNFRLILTGTPLENSTMDIWSQMDFVNPGLLGTKSYFKQEFLVPIEKKGDEKKTQRLNTILKPFILRRHKSQVATELPEKVEKIHYSNMTPEQEEIYYEVKSAYRNQILGVLDNKWLKSNKMVVLQGLTKLRQLANHPILADESYTGGSGKMEDVIEMIQTALGDDHKILIFSQFVKHLNLFRNHLNDQKTPYAYLDGSTRDRMQQVDRFQEDPTIRMFLISLKAGGLGLNLTKADYVFLLDPWWNPAVEAQAIDRTHRIGQANTVFAYKFITKDTVEEKIIALQQRKLRLSHDLITTEESFIKSLTPEDIDAILK